MFGNERNSSCIMKGFFLAAIAAIAVFAILIIASPCADAGTDRHGTYEGITYDFDGSSGTLSIGGEGGMNAQKLIHNYPWKEFRSEIRSIVIGDGVTDISYHAFEKLDNLTDVTIGKNVLILYYPFSECKNLRTINYNAVRCECIDVFCMCGNENGVILNFGDDVKEINTYKECPFFDNRYIMKTFVSGVTFGSQMDTINGYIFNDGTFIGETLDISNNIKYIEEGAFSSSPNLTTVNLGRGVERIGEEAFSSCPRLVSMTFNGDLEEIRNSAFEKCVSLKDIEFERTSSFRLGCDVFSGCTSLETLRVNVIGTFSTEECCFSGCTSLTEVEIVGSGTFTLGERCFSGCTSLTELDLTGDAAYRIGEHCFSACTSLTEVDLVGPGMYTVGDFAFADCTSLSVFICLSADRFGDGAFSNTALTVANLPDGLKHLGDGAYENCGSLTMVNVNAELTTIYGGTFSGCPISIIEFQPGTISILLEADAFPCYLVDKEGTPIYDKDDEYYDVTVRGRYFEPFAYKMLKDNETHEWGGDEPIPPVKPVKPAMEETDKELVLSKSQTSMMLSVTDVQAVKDAASNGKTVKIQLAGGTIVLDAKSAANIADGIQTAAIRPADTSNISPELKKRIGDHPVLDIRMGENHRFSGTVTVSVDYQLKDGEKADDLVVWHLKDDGTYETYSCTYKDGALTFTTDHMSDFAIVHSDVSYVTVYAAAGIIALMAIAILVLSHVRKNKA